LRPRHGVCKHKIPNTGKNVCLHGMR